MKHTDLVIAVVTLLACSAQLFAAEWQWSVPDGNARAYLWIPPTCQRVRGVVVASHNMIEMGILEHATMRRTLANLNFAEVWVAPQLELNFDFHKGAGEHFQRVMDALAETSGYTELKIAPIVPIGHSAHATYPWNFAAWNPARTLCVLSVKGDAPQTTLTGYGRANVDWGNRNIDGIPGVMVMSEQEWRDDRLTPAITFRAAHPQSPIASYAEIGDGHFGFSDSLVEFLAMFIRKSAEQRLPPEFPTPLDAPVPLKPIDPKQGWLIDRWHKDAPPAAPPAPFDTYTGDRAQAFFCFDQEMANWIESQYASIIGKKPQLVGFVQDGKILAGEPCTPAVITGDDGVTFHLTAQLLDHVAGTGGKGTLWTGLPNGAPIGHASGGGPVEIHTIVGPVRQVKNDLFAISLNRSVYIQDNRSPDGWICALQAGDSQYKAAVQQALLKIYPNKTGAEQTITFPPIADQKSGIDHVDLHATASSGMPVYYYVRQGPAELDGSTLRFTPIPPRAKLPISITVIAWQWGRAVEPKVRTACP